MGYRCVATSPEAVVQLIAASYLRHGYFWYVTGNIPTGKAASLTDRKLIEKYGIDISEWQRSRRRKLGLANAHLLRHDRWFILLLSAGHHAIRNPAAQGGEGEHIQDCRRVPIRFAGYSISYRQSGIASQGGGPTKWHAHVRIDGPFYAAFKAHFASIAVHRTAENIAYEFAKVPFARYAPIRRQLLNLLRMVNAQRKQHSYELLHHNVLKLSRNSVKVYAESNAEGVENMAKDKG